MQKKNDKGKVSLEQRVEDLERHVELLEKRLLRFLEAGMDVLTAVQKLAKIVSEQAGGDWEEFLRRAVEESEEKIPH